MKCSNYCNIWLGLFYILPSFNVVNHKKVASVPEFKLSDLIHTTRHTHHHQPPRSLDLWLPIVSEQDHGTTVPQSSNWLPQKWCCLAPKPRQLPSSATAPLPYQLLWWQQLQRCWWWWWWLLL